MKKSITWLSFIIIAACQNPKQKDIAEKNVAASEVSGEIHKELYGSWVGDFEASDFDEDELDDDFNYIHKINFMIKRITATEVIGATIVAGTQTPFIGTVSESGNTLFFTAKEPGNHPNDGTFSFHLEKGRLVGEWRSFNQKTKVRARKFNLVRKAFKYDPGLMLATDGEYVDYYSGKTDTVYYENENGNEEMGTAQYYRSASEAVSTLNASTDSLDTETLKNLKKLDIEIIRNTIFARHGYSFKKRTFRQFFDPVDWYFPVSDNVDAELTGLEKYNIALLKKFEAYAEDTYGDFGR